MPILRSIFVAFIFASIPFRFDAIAQESVALDHPQIEPGTAFEIGGQKRIEIEQSFQMGRIGGTPIPPILTAIELAIYCDGTAPLIEVYKTATGRRESYVSVRAADVADPNPTLKRYPLQTPFEHAFLGDYTIRISMANSNPRKTCTIGGGATDNPDPQATLRVRDAANREWVLFHEYFDTPQIDMAYRVLVSEPAPPPAPTPGVCQIAGGLNTVNIPNELSICRCFEDPDAFEFRCAIMTSDFFLLQRSPFPAPLDKPFEEVWEFMPLTKLDGPVTISLESADVSQPLSKTFGQGIKQGEVEKWSVKRSLGDETDFLNAKASLIYKGFEAEDIAVDIKRPVERQTLDQLKLQHSIPTLDKPLGQDGSN